jgi:hypothetical protein
MKYDIWTNEQQLNDVTYTDVYTLSGSRRLLHEMIWNVNKNDIIVRCVVDTETVFTFDLQVLSQDFKLGKTEKMFSVWEYDSNRWVFCPKHPIIITDHLTIQMISTKDTSTVHRGMTSWRAR